MCVVLGVKSVKRGNTFKYLILVFVIMASFFIFSKASVSAEEININENLSFVLEEVDGEYWVSSVNYSCSGTKEECAIEELVIPSEYNGVEIVGIKDGSVVVNQEQATKTFYGTLDGLKGVSIGKIVVGSKMRAVGACSFCNLEVDSVVLSGDVISVGEYAFGKSSVRSVYVNRYKSLAIDNIYTVASVKSFYDANNLTYIIFPSETVFSQYKNKSDVWKDLSVKDKYTYEIFYKFYDGSVEVEEKVYYEGFSFGELSEDLNKKGFNFLGWQYANGHVVDPLNDKPYGEEVNGKKVNSLISKWELKALEVEVKTFSGGLEDEDGKIVYGGKYLSSQLVMEVFARTTEVLEGAYVTYSWAYELDNGNKGVLEGHYLNSYGISFVNQSGKYICYVTLWYGETSRLHEVSVRAVVEPRTITVNVSDASVEYGTYLSINDFQVEIEEGYEGFAYGENWKYFKFEGFDKGNSEIAAGTYEGAVSVSDLFIGYDDDSSNYAGNYRITYNSGDLTVTKKALSVIFVGETTIEYGSEEVLAAKISQTVYTSDSNPDGIKKLLDVTYFRENPNVFDVGVYKIIGVEVNDSNYDISLEVGEYALEIVPKTVNVVWGDVSFTYDGSEKTVSAHYVTINNEEIPLIVNITKDSQEARLINAGEYLAKVDLSNVDSNYTLNRFVKDVEIEKAPTRFIEDSTQSTFYTGLAQTVSATPNHNEYSEADITVRNMLGGECKNATKDGNPCQIEVTVEETANYKRFSQMFNLYINKKEISVTPNLFEVTYGLPVGAYLIQEVEGVNGEIVKVKFQTSNNEVWDVGYHNIIGSEFIDAIDRQNYRFSAFNYANGVNKIKIVPAPVKIRFYFYENLVYDGNVHDIGVKAEGTSEDVGLSAVYLNNKIPVNAGEYTLNASISNPNFYIDGDSSLTFSIAKADYDVSSLRLEDKKVNFNFKSHSVLLKGKLPEGLSVRYTIDDNDGNGTFLPFKHTVKVIFEGDYENYNYVAPLEATLHVSMLWAFVVVFLISIAVGALVYLFIYLVKSKRIRFAKRIKRRVFVRIMKKNKALNEVNSIIVSARDSKKVEEEIPFIEENVKFTKTNPIRVNSEIVSKSFVDELFKAEPRIKGYYSEIKNELLSYMGVSSKIKRDYETFYLNNTPIARLNMLNGVLYAFYSLDPSLYNKQEYKHEDVSKKKEYGAVPMKLAVTSLESLRHAKMFVRIIRKRENVKSVSNFVRMDYAKVYTVRGSSFKNFRKVFSKKKKGEFEED